MRQTISGLVAAIAVLAASAMPAMACGLFDSGCGAPCSPCGQSYVAPVYSGCNDGCGPAGYGYGYERLPDPVQQYYYVNQGPTYTGPGSFAPYPTYQEGSVGGWNGYHHRAYHYGYGGGGYGGAAVYGYRAHSHYGYGYPVHRSIRYGYGYHHGYAAHYSLPPRGYYGAHRSMRYGYGYHTGMPHQYGYREHTMRRYY
jgi:hypothetical protein